MVTKVQAPTLFELRIGGDLYLAEKNGSKWVNALYIGNDGAYIDEPDLHNYVKEFNIGELGNVDISDSTSVVNKKLNNKLQTFFGHCWNTMERARVLAHCYLENDVYDRIMKINSRKNSSAEED